LNDCSRWNLDDAIHPSFAILITTSTRFSVLGLPLRIEMKGSEVTDIDVGNNANISTRSTATTVRTSVRHVFLAEKANATVPAFPGFQNNFSLVVEHTDIIENIVISDTMIAQPRLGVNASKKVASPQ
jgi:hypothetical protein